MHRHQLVSIWCAIFTSRIRYISSNAALDSRELEPVIIPALVELQHILPSKIPSAAQDLQHAVVVHGDFKVDNLIYGSSGACYFVLVLS